MRAYCANNKSQVQAHVVCLLGKAAFDERLRHSFHEFFLPLLSRECARARTSMSGWGRQAGSFAGLEQVAGDGASEKAMHLDASDEPEVRHSYIQVLGAVTGFYLIRYFPKGLYGSAFEGRAGRLRGNQRW